MILEKEVIRTYKGGRKEVILIEDLTRVSGISVTRICDNCGKHEKRKYHNVLDGMDFCEGKQLCKKCSQNTIKRKEISKKGGNTTYLRYPDRYKGKHLTKEICSRGGKAGAQARIGTESYKKAGKKVSESLKLKYRNGELVSAPPKGIRTQYNNITFRSTWEAKFAKYLDENNIKWKFEPKTFLLKVNNSYLPDFYLEESNIWIEVKGYWREDALRKFNEFKLQYPQEIIIVVDSLNFESFDIVNKINLEISIKLLSFAP